MQVSIKFLPYGARDEAGLYLWVDPLNYIKIIVQGPRRQTSKPEITIATQQDGLPTSSPTYWLAKGIPDVANKEYIVRLEINAVGDVISDNQVVWLKITVSDGFGHRACCVCQIL